MSQKKRANVRPNRVADDPNITREWLYKIIEEEVVKEESEQDLELIMECAKCLEELTPSLELSEAEYTAGLREIYARAAVGKKTNKKRRSMEKHQLNVKSTAILTTKNKARSKIRFVIIPVTVIVCLFLSIVIVSATQSMTVKELIVSVMDNIIAMNPGETIENTNITLVKGDKITTFTSVKEAVDNCTFEFMYPMMLPDGICVEKIIEARDESPEDITIMFVTNHDGISISVNDHITVDMDRLKNVQTYEAKNLSFSIIEIGTAWQAIGVQDGVEYIVICHKIDYSDFLIILDGISGE